MLLLFYIISISRKETLPPPAREGGKPSGGGLSFLRDRRAASVDWPVDAALASLVRRGEGVFAGVGGGVPATREAENQRAAWLRSRPTALPKSPPLSSRTLRSCSSE